MQSSKIRFPTAGAAHAATPCCTRFPHTHRRPPSACAPLRGTNRLPHRPQTTFPEHQYRAEGHRLLLPGFYNVHSHAPMTLLRGYAENLPLQRWLGEKVFPFEDLLDEEAE